MYNKSLAGSLCQIPHIIIIMWECTSTARSHPAAIMLNAENLAFSCTDACTVYGNHRNMITIIIIIIIIIINAVVYSNIKF